MQDLENKSVLLIISGGIAAYKSLELIRLIRKSGGHVRCILTNGGAQFVTPLSVSALSEEQVYDDLWSLKDETEMGHIRLSREADIILVAPASANIIAQMAHGLAQDLATTTLLAADKPIIIAPAMNHRMWTNPATQDNIQTLKNRGISIIEPTEGDMACGEYGPGRMEEPENILKAINGFFLSPAQKQAKPLEGYSAIVTSGPTYEPLDPVRFIGNRSSGKQGHAIARALQTAGANVTLITGPVSEPDPHGVNCIHIETAEEMLSAAENALESNGGAADIAICAAAVSDWRPENQQDHKIKKRADESPAAVKLKENPDILKTLSNHSKRPRLVIGFAAETNNLESNAKEKLKRKNCDWILANLVGQTDKKVFGEDQNHVYLITKSEKQDWQPMSKQNIASRLTDEIIEFFQTIDIQDAAE